MVRGQELCEREGGRPGFPVVNKPEGVCVCGREATVKKGKQKTPYSKDWLQLVPLNR